MTNDNRISGPTVEEFAQKYNTEVVVLSSPRGEYHNAVIAVHGTPIHLTRVFKTAEEARDEALGVAQQAWRNQKARELEAAQAEPLVYGTKQSYAEAPVKLPRKGRIR